MPIAETVAESPSPRGFARVALAWLGMWGAFGGLATVAITVSRLLGEAETRLMLFSWAIAATHTILIEVRARAPRPTALGSARADLAHARRPALLARAPSPAQEPLVIALFVAVALCLGRGETGLQRYSVA